MLRTQVCESIPHSTRSRGSHYAAITIGSSRPVAGLGSAGAPGRRDGSRGVRPLIRKSRFVVEGHC